ncbi:hypothetical protein [Stenotrophomonas panacihumi]|uniref:hypothetical protein n=1 Tax=Stenotrophomonas panacihumi TaxID=676599 RepID=UPI000B13837F|nr:hypothetical protein [Stenotrophomonas panacihumi]
MSQQQFDQAYESGRRARQAGKSRDSSPRYGMDHNSLLQRERWREGWDDEDRERRAAA